mgnify:CR=1 FL=1
MKFIEAAAIVALSAIAFSFGGILYSVFVWVVA